MKPSKFKKDPMGSVLQKSESETIARNIMVILARTGDTFRPLSWEEYKAERTKDGDFSNGERSYFDAAIDFCKSPDTARLFSPVWEQAYLKAESVTPVNEGQQQPVQGEGFTPGEWKVMNQGYGRLKITSVSDIENSANDKDICSLYGDATKEETEATARLIASCPTLYRENQQLKERVKDLEDAAIIDMAFNPLKAELEAAKGILKTVRFWFGNEANYPEGTGGYKIVQEINALLNQ